MQQSPFSRETGATSGPGVLATFGYDDLGQRTSLTRGNGTTTTYGHDPVSRLSSLAQDLGGTGADLTLGFGYTPASQISGVTRSNDAYSWGGAVPLNDTSAINGITVTGATIPILAGITVTVATIPFLGVANGV